MLKKTKTHISNFLNKGHERSVAQKNHLNFNYVANNVNELQKLSVKC